jgi:hypothetical protein
MVIEFKLANRDACLKYTQSYDGILCMEGDRRLGGVFAN